MTELIVKHFSELSTSELYEILKTRFKMFDEQPEREGEASKLDFIK